MSREVLGYRQTQWLCPLLPDGTATSPSLRWQQRTAQLSCTLSRLFGVAGNYQNSNLSKSNFPYPLKIIYESNNRNLYPPSLSNLNFYPSGWVMNPILKFFDHAMALAHKQWASIHIHWTRTKHGPRRDPSLGNTRQQWRRSIRLQIIRHGHCLRWRSTKGDTHQW